MMPPPAATAPRSSQALVCLLFALVLPLGLALFALRDVVASQPSLHPVPSALNLILQGGASIVILIGIPASAIAIALGHNALGRVGQALSGRRTRRIARTGLALGYLSLGVVLAMAGFTAFWLSTQPMHLAW